MIMAGFTRDFDMCSEIYVPTYMCTSAQVTEGQNMLFPSTSFVGGEAAPSASPAESADPDTPTPYWRQPAVSAFYELWPLRTLPYRTSPITKLLRS